MFSLRFAKLFVLCALAACTVTIDPFTKRERRSDRPTINGWYRMSEEAAQNMILQVENIQLAMFNEGPGAGHEHGHYMNMMNPLFRRVGVGLATVDGELYLTNDFSE